MKHAIELLEKELTEKCFNRPWISSFPTVESLSAFIAGQILEDEKIEDLEKAIWWIENAPKIRRFILFLCSALITFIFLTIVALYPK